MTHLAQAFSEKGLLPDSMVRAGIRRLLRTRLEDIGAASVARQAESELQHLHSMRHAAIAEHTDKANEQHYELPPAFFGAVLGARRKYSCGYWPDGVTDLDASEEAALAATVEHAGLKNGQSILELGCGWGSLSLYMARRFPDSKITVVSNAARQGETIRALAAAEGLDNLCVITADMNHFEVADSSFDRVVSVEMFEHMRNWEKLLARINRWLKPGGKLFLHIFVHRTTPYLFEDRGASDWMSRHFFSGGMMPSASLPLRCLSPMQIEQCWYWSGDHYEKTCNAWLARMDSQKDTLMPLFEDTYGRDFAPLWWQRWRMFFMACAELFGYDGGNQWFVAHYRFGRLS